MPATRIAMWMEGNTAHLRVTSNKADGFSAVKRHLEAMRDRLTSEIERGSSECPYSTRFTLTTFGHRTECFFCARVRVVVDKISPATAIRNPISQREIKSARLCVPCATLFVKQRGAEVIKVIRYRKARL